MNEPTAVIKISRFGTPGFELDSFATYDVPYNAGWSVLDVLNYIYTNLDGTLIHPFYCRSGVCAGCLVEVNGKKLLACKTAMEMEMTIRPANKETVARDLIEDGRRRSLKKE